MSAGLDVEFGDPRLPERFWDKVHPEPMSGCWLWGGAVLPHGYGYMRHVDGSGRNGYPHRIMLETALGRSLPTEVKACHRCDVPACCNPAHLFSGTQGDNLADMSRKGRSLRGERSPTSKLTLADVISIHRATARGELQRVIASEHGIRQQTVSRIVNGKRWAHAS